MLRLTIRGDEQFNEVDGTFIEGEILAVVELEHSLVSLSKWEAKHEKAFLSPQKKTAEETLDYFQFMIVTPNVDPNILVQCTRSDLQAIQKYIDSNQSATKFGAMPKSPAPREAITSELIYYWMIGHNVPFECETWHLNRLFSLLRVCNMKNSKPKPMSRRELAQRNAELNARRRAELGTTG